MEAGFATPLPAQFMTVVVPAGAALAGAIEPTAPKTRKLAATEIENEVRGFNVAPKVS